MAIAEASRPELIIGGTVTRTRNITRRDDKSQVIGIGYGIEAPNGDRLSATAWASDAPQMVGLTVGETFAAIAYPSGDQLNLLRPLDTKDLDTLAGLAGVK